jgi:hypothetical protein
VGRATMGLHRLGCGERPAMTPQVGRATMGLHRLGCGERPAMTPQVGRATMGLHRLGCGARASARPRHADCDQAAARLAWRRGSYARQSLQGTGETRGELEKLRFGTCSIRGCGRLSQAMNTLRIVT